MKQYDVKISHAALQVGIKEIQNGDTVDAASAFAQFREQHR